MNELSVAFTFLLSIMLLTSPPRLAPLPLLLAVAFVPRGVVLELGPAHLSVLRILVAVGLLRVLIKRESVWSGGANIIDRLIVFGGVWCVATSAFHTPDAWIYRAGLVWDQLGSYFLFRAFLRTYDDILEVFKMVCFVLLPVSALMLVEQTTGHNPFAVFGGDSAVLVRDGIVRARGPFTHPILAGTVGAGCLPMALSWWRYHRGYAVIGLLAASGIVLTSNSSGPIMMAVFTLIAMALWAVRDRLSTIRWLAVLALISLAVVMKAPVYFLIARIDLTGGSQGWYRAQLIQSSLDHLDEWWLVGTDHTRHWMATGIDANASHTDLANHFLWVGVMGGLPLLSLFAGMLLSAFQAVGGVLRQRHRVSPDHHFLVWTVGAMLFGHIVNFLSISLFDHTIVFFCLVLAAIGAFHTRPSQSRKRAAGSRLHPAWGNIVDHSRVGGDSRDRLVVRRQ